MAKYLALAKLPVALEIVILSNMLTYGLLSDIDVLIEPSLIRKVIQNLVKDACAFSPPNGTITLQAWDAECSHPDIDHYSISSILGP
jgi:signal transduction histidine kinase